MRRSESERIKESGQRAREGAREASPLQEKRRKGREAREASTSCAARERKQAEREQAKSGSKRGIYLLRGHLLLEAGLGLLEHVGEPALPAPALPWPPVRQRGRVHLRVPLEHRLPPHHHLGHPDSGASANRTPEKKRGEEKKKKRERRKRKRKRKRHRR